MVLPQYQFFLFQKKWGASTQNIVVFWITTYYIFKVGIINNRPLIGGVYTYLSVVEIIMLTLTILLARMLLENIQELENTVANITLSDVSPRVKKLEDSIRDIDKEITRSRRYNRPLGLLVLQIEPEIIEMELDSVSKDILDLMMRRYSISKLLRAIDKEIRRPDLIFEQQEENRIIILLPETEAMAIDTVKDHIQKIAAKHIDTKVTFGSASFPNDAITFEELINQVENLITNP